MNITYINNSSTNSISCLDDSELSDYILSIDEQKYFDSIYNNALSYISSVSLSAAIKAGSTLYTQDKLNKIYVNKNNSYGFTDEDIDKMKKFMDKSMIGNEIVSFEEFL